MKQSKDKTVLKFPNPIYLSIPPSIANYDQVTQISYSDFNNIFQFLTDNKYGKNRLENLIDKELSEMINYYNKQKLSNLVRHILFLNRENMEMEEYTEKIVKINSLLLPTWISNNFQIDKGFRELFILSEQWNFNAKAVELMRSFLTYHESSLNSEFYDNMIGNLENDHWNFRNLSIIMDLISNKDYLIRQQDETDYSKLKDELEEFMIHFLFEFDENIDRKTALTFLLVQSYINRGGKYLKSAQDILDNLFEEIMNDDDKPPYKFLFFSYYAIIGNQLFQRNINYKSKRRLLGNILPRYIDDVNSNDSQWKKLLSSGNVLPIVFDKLLQGFSSLIEMITWHIKELPDGKTKSNLVLNLDILSNFVSDTFVEHYCLNYQFISPQESIDLFTHQFEKFPISDHYKFNLYELLSKSTKYMILIKKERIESSYYQKKIDLWLKMIDVNKSIESKFIYELLVLLITDKYPFREINQLILDDLPDSQTIYTSKTFEDRIIKVITDILNYLSKLEKTQDRVDTNAYEILLYFTTEWLQYFSLSKRLFYEASNVLTAIIVMCLTQLTRGYLENRYYINAFLMYINLFFFLEYITNKSYYSREDGSTGEVNMQFQDISDKFIGFIKDWDIGNLLEMKFKQISASKLELSITKTNTRISEPETDLRGMLSDELLFAYLDKLDELKQFLSNQNNITETEFILNLRHSKLYKPPEPNSISLLERIGSVCTKIGELELPFPLIRNIHQYGVAVSMDPTQISLPEIMSEDQLLQSINELFDQGQ